jgi:hypothetical protein
MLQGGGGLVQRHGLAEASVLPAFRRVDQRGDVADDLVPRLSAADGTPQNRVDCLQRPRGEVVPTVFEPVVDVVGG